MTDPVSFGTRIGPGGPFQCEFRSAKGAPVIGTREPTLFAFLSGFSTHRGYAGSPVASHQDFQSALAAGLQRPQDHVVLRQGKCFVTYAVKESRPFTLRSKELDKKLVNEVDSWLVGQSGSSKLAEVEAEVAAFIDGAHDQPADAAPDDRVVVVEHRTEPKE